LQHDACAVSFWIGVPLGFRSFDGARMKNDHAYWPSLDGWRAIAVLAVILYHDSLYSFGTMTTSWFQTNGYAGVDLFFGISGFLICTRLLEDERFIGRISLKKFYVRRAFRILPPALFYLCAIAALGVLKIIPLLPKEWFAAMFFGRNYSFLSATPGHEDWFTAHYWSLSLEEHFYLILPGVLVFLPRRFRVFGLTSVAGTVVCWRWYRQLSHPWNQLYKHTDTRLDALLFPAILAVLLASTRWEPFIRFAGRFWLLAAALLLLFLTYNPFPFVTPTAESILIPIVILGPTLNPTSIAAKFLELPPLRWLGKISYSLYLWQQIFFSGHFLPSFRPLGFLNAFPFRWFSLLCVATASYYFLEKPAIRYGHRITESSPTTAGCIEA
jgi:peptidoglycan/LPS O-acetylase OafA/YrhL